MDGEGQQEGEDAVNDLLLELFEAAADDDTVTISWDDFSEFVEFCECDGTLIDQFCQRLNASNVCTMHVLCMYYAYIMHVVCM